VAKVLCVLYDDPVDGYPPPYARDDIPTIEGYPNGQSAPSPERIDFEPGQLLGSVSGELGLRQFLEKRGHTLVVEAAMRASGSRLEAVIDPPMAGRPGSTPAAQKEVIPLQ